jgi:hypothetical protein
VLRLPFRRDGDIGLPRASIECSAVLLLSASLGLAAPSVVPTNDALGESIATTSSGRAPLLMVAGEKEVSAVSASDAALASSGEFQGLAGFR